MNMNMKMKVLVIDALFFRLPDDFEGGLSDALRAMADYHDDPVTLAGQEREVESDKGEPWRKMRDKMWYEFMDTVEGGQRLRGSVTIVETTDGKTLRLDPNTGEPSKEKKS